MRTGAVATNLSKHGKDWKNTKSERKEDVMGLGRQNTFVVKKKSKSREGRRDSEIPVISPEVEDDKKRRNTKNSDKKREKTHVVDKEGKRRHSDPIQARNSTHKGILKQNTSEQLKAELTKPKRHRKSSKGLPPLSTRLNDNSKSELKARKFDESVDALPAVLPGVKTKQEKSRIRQHHSSDENNPDEKNRSAIHMSPLSMATYNRHQSMLRVKRHYANLNLADYEKSTISTSSIQSLTPEKEVNKGRRLSGVKLESLPKHSVKSTSVNSLTSNSIYAKLWSSDASDVLTEKNVNQGQMNTRMSLPTPSVRNTAPSRKAISLSKHPSNLAPTDDIHKQTTLVREKGKVRRRLKPIER